MMSLVTSITILKIIWWTSKTKYFIRNNSYCNSSCNNKINIQDNNIMKKFLVIFFKSFIFLYTYIYINKLDSKSFEETMFK